MPKNQIFRKKLVFYQSYYFFLSFTRFPEFQQETSSITTTSLLLLMTTKRTDTNDKMYIPKM